MTLDFPDWANPIEPGQFQLSGQGVRLVAATGTPVALRASTIVKTVMIKARAANVGTVYLGSSTVTNDENVNTGGLQLARGDMVTFAETDLAHVYINGTLGDGVSFAYWA